MIIPEDKLITKMGAEILQNLGAGTITEERVLPAGTR